MPKITQQFAIVIQKYYSHSIVAGGLDEIS